MPKTKNEINKTFLDPDGAEERGILHRDMQAHVWRWTHVMRNIKSSTVCTLLDLGCGKLANMAVSLYANRRTKVNYVGVDYGKVSPHKPFSGSWQPTFMENTDISELDYDAVRAIHGGPPDYVTCFEVAEHMHPDRWLRALKRLRDNVTQDTVIFISTPCYDPRVGAADNHVNEMTYEFMRASLWLLGFNVEKHWGTFASERDYEKEIVKKFGIEGRRIFDLMGEYYDTELRATFWAPLFPQHSRNVIWRIRKGTERRDNGFMSTVKEIKQLGQLSDPAPWAAAAEILGVEVTW